MADVLERALNARVAPCRIVAGHPHDELTDLEGTPRRPAPLAYVHFRAINWRCHRRNVSGVANRGNLVKGCTADSVRSRRKSPAIIVREPQPTATNPAPEGSVLFDQVREGVPLPTVQPPGQHQQHDLQRGGVDHERTLYHDRQKDVRRLVEHFYEAASQLTHTARRSDSLSEHTSSERAQPFREQRYARERVTIP
jgi:hypothetical protein